MAFLLSINKCFLSEKEREEMSMKKNNKNVGNVRYTVNLISGACTMPLIEKLFSSSGKISDMDGALVPFYNQMSKNAEIYKLMSKKPEDFLKSEELM